MAEYVGAYWFPILVALVAAAILAFLLLRPRQRVELSDSAPTRPHMAQQPERANIDKSPEPVARPLERSGEGSGLGDSAAAATSDVTGDILQSQVHSQLPGASGPPDDLQKLKGVGPKLAELLNARGIIRYEQIARLNPDEVERLEAGLGAFRGRIQRDRIVEQADYLARGDVDGFEHRFGKL